MINDTQYCSQTTIKNQEPFMNDPTLVDPDVADTSGVNIMDINDDDLENHFTSTDEIQLAMVAAMIRTEDVLQYALSRVSPVSFTHKADQLICRIVLEYYKQFRKVPPTRDFKQIILNEMKKTNGEDKAFSEYQARLNIVCDYASEMFPIEYLKEEINTHRIRTEYGKMVRKGLQEAQKPTTSTDSIIEKAADGVRHLKSYQDKKERKALFVDEMDELGENQWLIKDHVFRNCFCTVFGMSGGGKSFFLIDWAMCIATGQPYLGIYDTRKGKVAYVCTEGQTGIKKRIMAWSQEYNIPINHNICVLPCAFDLMKTSEADELIQLIKDKLGDDVEAVIIDTMSRNIGEGDDRSNEINTFISNLDYIKTTLGCTIIPVHHTGHENHQRPRGAKNLIDASDVMLRVTPDDKIDVAHNWISEIHQFKIKEQEGFPNYQLRKHVVDLGTTTSCVWKLMSPEDYSFNPEAPESPTNDDKVLEVIPVLDIDEDPTEDTTVSQKDICEKAGLHRNTVSPILKAMRDNQSILDFKKDKSANRPVRYYRHSWS